MEKVNVTLTSYELEFFIDLLNHKIELNNHILACKIAHYNCESEVVSQEVYLESLVNLRHKLHQYFLNVDCEADLNKESE